MNKIGTRFITLLIGSVIVIAVTLTYFSLSYGNRLVSELSQKRLLDELGRFTESVNTELFAKEVYVDGLGAIVSGTFDIDEFESDPDYLEKYEKELLPIMEEYVKDNISAFVYFNPLELGKTMDIWFFDGDGDGKTERVPQVKIEYYDDPAGKDWFFTPAKTKREFWTDPYPSTIVEDYTFVSHTKPVIIDDRVIAVVGTDFEYTRFENELINYQIYESGYAFLLNEYHKIIVHPLGNQYESILDIGDGEFDWIYQEMNRSESGVIEYTWLDGEDKILSYARLRNGWIIGLTANKREIYEGINAHAIRLTLVSVILMILISIIGFLSSRRITRPLEGIVNQVKNIGEGDYNSKISSELISDVTEIGILSDVVEEMRENLKKSFELIQEHNEELDMKVELRTNELNRANKELKESIGTLRKTQKELLISEKQKSIAYIIIEIAHRLNTPIGNTLTLLTFIEGLNNRLYNELESERPSAKKIWTIAGQFDDATSNAVENIKKASGIIGSLKEFSFNDKQNKVTKLVFPDFIKKSVLQDKSVILDNVSVSLRGGEVDGIEFYSNAYLVFKLFVGIISFSSFFRMKSPDIGAVEIYFDADEDYVDIDYIDRGIVVEEKLHDKVFEPFAFTSFETGAHGIELYLAYNIVIQGLGGSISYEHNEDGILHLNIRLPKEEYNKELKER